MVLSTSGNEEESTEEPTGITYGTTDEEFIDSDKTDSNMMQGPALANPRITSLFTTQRSWRVLRLPGGGRAGEEGASGLRGFANFMLQIIPGWRGQTIRDSPFRQMITARMWQQYINNMEAIDDALELQAPYGPEELLSLRMFCEEWTQDPGHVRFTRRLSNHPSTNTSDSVLKGNMVYDLCTGQINLRTSRGERGEGNIPIRMAHDILTSIPFQEYNYYTLNSVHAQEGSAIYEGFLNRAIRLSSTEVAMVEEIEQGIRASGRGYATMSTNISGDPIEAFALMLQVVEALDMMDTTTVRAGLNALISPPYNYKSMAQQIDVAGTHGGRFVTTDQVRHVNMNVNSGRHMGQDGQAPFDGSNREQMMVYAQGRGKNGELIQWPSEQPTRTQNHPPVGYFMRVNNNGIGVHSVLEVFEMGGNRYIRVANQDDQVAQISQMVGGFQAQDRARRDSRPDDGGRADRSAADRRQSIRSNPSPWHEARQPTRGWSGERHSGPGEEDHYYDPGTGVVDKGSNEPRANRFGGSTTMGRGNFIYVEILPKTQVSFTGKYKGTKGQKQYWEQGGTRVGDKTGLGKVFTGGPEVTKAKKGGYFIKTALHKRTGVEVPWLVAVPRESFQAFTDSEGRRTLRPKRRKAEADPAWAKFIRFYGTPSYKGGAGKQNLFAIKKADKGTFYDDLRSKPSKR